MSGTVLITGAGGMLGQKVHELAAAHGFGTPVAAGRARLDITDAAAIDAVLDEVAPDAIINCAAWSDVDGAEEHEQQAYAINATGAGLLARGAARRGIRLIHVSTDYVFAGDDPLPRREDDPTGPKTAYGRTKLAGEQAVLDAGGDALIVRTAWLFGAGGKNFVDTMLALGGERDRLQVVSDQVGCPTWTGHLAPALLGLATGNQRGIAHLAGDGSVSWFGLAREALTRAGVDVVVEETDSSTFRRPAPRPAWSILAATRLDMPRLPAWQDGLDGHLAEIGRLAHPGPYDGDPVGPGTAGAPDPAARIPGEPIIDETTGKPFDIIKENPS